MGRWSKRFWREREEFRDELEKFMCGIACNEGEMLLGIGGMPVLGAHAPSYMMSPLRGCWAEGAGACSGHRFILGAHAPS